MTSTTTDLLAALGVPAAAFTGGQRAVRSPIDGAVIGQVHDAAAADMTAAIGRAHEAFLAWRTVPAPKRGELVRLFGEELRANKAALARLVSLEAGKITQRGRGRSPGNDRHLRLRRRPVAPALRPDHRLRAPRPPHDGAVPGTRWAWSASSRPSTSRSRCGRGTRRWRWSAATPCVWKPSEKTPLTALATQALFEKAVARYEGAPRFLSQVILGGAPVGEALVDDARVALVSATGCTRMGRAVGPRVAARFGRCLLELGGNNAIILAPSADLDLAVRGILFGAVGTAGQRCTTMRRLIAHASVHDELVARLDRARAQLKIGSPVEPGNLIGPLIDQAAFDAMQAALAAAREQGGEVSGGERALASQYPEAFYAVPALVRDARADRRGAARDLRADPLRAEVRDAGRGHRAAERRAAGPVVVRSSPTTSARPRPSSARAARTAASPTSTSAPRARRSAAPSAARRKPAAAASPARTRGRPTCAARPTPSTTRASCRWPRA